MIVQPKQEFFQGTVESRNFDIDLSDDVNFSVAFDIISSGIYKDKPLAIVRELCSNAQDSHARAGTTRPFTVHVPTALEPYWSVRDYGTGLAEADVYRLLAGIFNSDKRKTNKEIGGYGLGSKTPFSYTDVYDITSWFNGMSYCFSAYRDGVGKPCVALTTSYPSDEPNGVLISVPVKQADCRKFVDATQEGLKFFFPKPEITGSQMVSFAMPTILAGQDHWIAVDKLKGVRVLMGPVAYPLDPDLMRLDVNDPDESRIYRFLKSANGFVLTVRMGQIRVTASREDISYTQDTILALKKIVADTIDSVSRWIGGHLDSIGSPVDACMAYHRLSALIGTQMLDSVNFTYDGFPLKPWITVHSSELEGIAVRLPYAASRNTRPVLEAMTEESINVRLSTMGADGLFEAPVFFYFKKLSGASARYALYRKSLTNAERSARGQFSKVVLLGDKAKLAAFAQSIGTTIDSGLFFDLEQIEMPRTARAGGAADPIRVLDFTRVLIHTHSRGLTRDDWHDSGFDDFDSLNDAVGPCYVMATKGNHPVINGMTIDSCVVNVFKAINAAMTAGMLERRAFVGVSASELRRLKKEKADGVIGDEIEILDDHWRALRADTKKIRSYIFDVLRTRLNSPTHDWDSRELHGYKNMAQNARHLRFMMASKSPIFSTYRESLKAAIEHKDVSLKYIVYLLPVHHQERMRLVLNRVSTRFDETRGRYSQAVLEIFETIPALKAYMNPHENLDFFDAQLA